jgi:hypothetical protein
MFAVLLVESARKQLALLVDQVSLILGEIEHLDHQLARVGAQRASATTPW